MSGLLLLLVLGCGSERPVLAGNATEASAGRPAGDPPGVSRLQKPEMEERGRPPGGSLFDLPGVPFEGPSDSRVAVRIRATVNGVAILDDEVRDATFQYVMELQNIPEPQRSAALYQVYQRELQRIIEREVILQDALGQLAKTKMGQKFIDKLKEEANKQFDRQVLRALKAQAPTATDEELKSLLRAQGLSLEGMRRQFERSFMAMEYMKSKIFPVVDRIGPEQLREYYREHPEEFEVPDSVKWQDIFIAAGGDRAQARRLAEQLADRIRKGEDFVKLCKEYDQGDSVYRNGEGHGHRPGEIKPREVEPILFRMRDGEVGPIVEQANGFHVIRLVKREHAGRVPFDEKTQATIRNKLRGAAAEQEYKRIVAELKRKATIHIDPATP
jgi:parvulin-like peptidyl-prolyl isomerase